MLITPEMLIAALEVGADRNARIKAEGSETGIHGWFDLAKTAEHLMRFVALEPPPSTTINLSPDGILDFALRPKETGAAESNLPGYAEAIDEIRRKQLLADYYACGKRWHLPEDTR